VQPRSQGDDFCRIVIAAVGHDPSLHGYSPMIFTSTRLRLRPSNSP
jgi:hypothetical protein